ncbi:hypothetical protein [Microbacterium sp. NPDC058345]|uniref:hypothetical protein n=1 Tax=Microbacterium sp. NPDC058345 TaxID=3346455 RepID=UPI0036671FC4
MSPVRIRSLVFYAVVVVALLVLVFRLQYLVVSEGLGARIGHNSEALGLVLLICLLVQYVRPWAQRSARLLRTLLILAALVGVYLILHFAVPITSVSTLDECFSGAAYIWVYMMVPKRFRVAPAWALVILAVIIVFFHTQFVLEQAESLIPLLIAPIALDIMDRTILDPDLPDRRVRRIVWMIVLALVGLTFMMVAPWARDDLDSVFTLFIDYGQRASESYWAWILVHAYFGFFVTPRLRAKEHESVADETTSRTAS